MTGAFRAAGKFIGFLWISALAFVDFYFSWLEKAIQSRCESIGASGGR